MSESLGNSAVNPIPRVNIVQDVFPGNNGQVVISSELLSRIGVNPNTRLKVVYDGEQIVVMDAARYAVEQFQKDMEGEAERLGLKTDEDVYEMWSQLRHGGK